MNVANRLNPRSGLYAPTRAVGQGGTRRALRRQRRARPPTQHEQHLLQLPLPRREVQLLRVEAELLDQQVDTREQDNSNEHVAQPAELAVGKQNLLEGAAYLGSGAGRVINLSTASVHPRHPAMGLATCTLAHREQNDGHCECDCRQHSHAHAQDQHIKRVHLAVGVQQLGLYPVCGRQGGWSAGGPGRGLGSEPGLTLTLWGVATDSPPQPQGTDRHHRPNERL